MALIKKCTNCGAALLLGKKVGDDLFCNDICLEHHLHPGFCPECVSETTEESPGGTFTLNGIGIRLYGTDAKCPTCRSVIKRKWFCIVFIPVIPLRRFRIKPVTVSRYMGRRILHENLRPSRMRVTSVAKP